ncbi:MAG TPA: hypothetical protein VGX00_03175 [Thermoplasmata archaeon]|nr:hypothetical protein [Thermoplasmata archaeon]
MNREAPTRLERSLLIHLLSHRGAQVRFEADQWTTEFGILRAFAQVELAEVKNTLRQLEMGRFVYRRVQYVIGYTEPKLVYSLTPSGHRVALTLSEEGSADPPEADLPTTPGPGRALPRVDRSRISPD